MRLALVLQHRGADRSDRHVAQQPLGEVHQPPVLVVRGVELHHRELGVVARRQPLVAEVAVDLEHAVEAADHQPLQEQFRRDAQVHVDVERVVVRDEGLGRRAARDHLQHRRLDFEEALVDHELAHRRDRLAADHEGGARLLVHHQVDVALAVALLAVLEPVELVGQRPQRLGEQAQLLAAHRQLALLRLEQHAARRDDVAEVPALERLVRGLAGVVVGDVELDPTGAVLDRREARLAHHALEHHAAGQHDLDVRLRERLAVEVAVAGRQVAGDVLADEVVREGGAVGAQRGELGAPLRDDLVLVGRAGGRGGGGWGGVVHRVLRRRARRRPVVCRNRRGRGRPARAPRRPRASAAVRWLSW